MNAETTTVKCTNRAARSLRRFADDYQPFSRVNQDSDALRQLVAGVAHVYNNLLTSMLCGTALALDNLAADHPSRPALIIASRAVEQAAAVTRQLMAYAGPGQLAATRLDLPALLHTLVAELRSSIPDRVQLSLDVATDLPPLQADSRQIEQLLGVLIANAVEAIGEERAAAVSIRVYAARALPDPPCGAGLKVHIEVMDTGCGMDEWTRSRIFEPFFSTKFPGRGMGLAAAEGIVRSHGGTIEVFSSPASGSTFRVSLPAGLPVDEPGSKERKWKRS